MALIIKENFKLKSLKVAMNKIDDTYGAKILKALAKNDQLEELDLSVNDLGALVYYFINLVICCYGVFHKNKQNN